MKYAGEKHCDQLVPGTSANYLLHIANVTMEVIMAHREEDNFDLDLAMQVAILHDTIEDTDATYDDLSDKFGSRVADGVLALTKDSTLPSKSAKMADSLQRIEAQPIEIAIVKLCDRITNLQKPPSHWPKEKVSSYLTEARLIAATLSGYNHYLNVRIRRKMEEYGNYL